MMIAVDAHGGDYAPREVIKGAIEAAEDYKVDIALVGRKSILQKLARSDGRRSNLTFIDATQTIECKEDPFEAVSNKPDSSIVVGIKLVKDGIASAFVSAGNTGALTVAAFLNLGRIEGVQRIAVCAVQGINTANPVLIIDAGVNVDCRPSFLVQFAQLATIFSREVLGMSSPRVGLLNNGEEETKGNLLAKDTYQLLKKTNLNFIGNVEGQEVLKGKADVIVTDGFTGNILIKTIEGLGSTFQDLLEAGEAIGLDHQLTGSALVHYMELASTAKQVDYQELGGACVLGLNGNVIIAHGRSKAKAIKNAIHLAHRAARAGLVEALKNGDYVSE